jgi:hypothetical protein
MENMLVSFMGICSTLRPFGIFYEHLVILRSFCIFSPVLVNFIKKNLATLPKISKFCLEYVTSQVQFDS